jgi:hypothetical protein
MLMMLIVKRRKARNEENYISFIIRSQEKWSKRKYWRNLGTIIGLRKLCRAATNRKEIQYII